MNNKFFNDVIHGLIELSEIAVSIIDTIEFQRLRNIKQLSTVHYVFPSATHTRFEHSLGVAYLGKKLITMLSKNQPELGINEKDILRIEIAGLCHDLGHGPFSHTFDNEFIKKHSKRSEILYKKHEERSIMILDNIIKKYNINLTDEDIKKISYMINPKRYNMEICKEDKKFLYSIISNEMNGLDVDKFDYISRDTFYLGLKFGCEFRRIFDRCRIIDNKIVFLKKEALNIYEIFNSRYRLHKLIYNHTGVKAIEYMITDMLFILDRDMDFVNIINDMNMFIKVDDNILNLSYILQQSKQLNKLYNKLHSRELYKLKEKIKFSDGEYDREKLILKLNNKYGKENYHIDEMNFKDNYKKNLINNIYFYDKRDLNKIIDIKCEDEYLVISEKNNDKIINIFIK